MKVSEARKEKNFQDAKAEFKSMEAQKIRDLRIEHLYNEIAKDKEKAKQCIDMNYIGTAQEILKRISRTYDQINKLRFQ